jgi:hypothetical protein
LANGPQGQPPSAQQLIKAGDQPYPPLPNKDSPWLPPRERGALRVVGGGRGGGMRRRYG